MIEFRHLNYLSLNQYLIVEFIMFLKFNPITNLVKLFSFSFFFGRNLDWSLNFSLFYWKKTWNLLDFDQTDDCTPLLLSNREPTYLNSVLHLYPSSLLPQMCWTKWFSLYYIQLLLIYPHDFIGVCLLLRGPIMLLQYTQSVTFLYLVGAHMLLVSMICMFLTCKL